jgi:hypothetical protein
MSVELSTRDSMIVASDAAARNNRLRQAANPDIVPTFLPIELVGGSVPYIAGMEDETVWHAASQACATNSVCYAFTVFEGRCWYLAAPASAMANNPDSWCPLTAALPGNSEFWDTEAIYIYEQDGVAAALRWDPETHKMQVFDGPSRTILPHVQSLEANFVAIDPTRATVVPWINRNLREEQLMRSAIKWLLLSGLGVALTTVVYLVFLQLTTMWLRPSLAEAQSASAQATQQLMLTASRAAQSDSDKYLIRLQELLLIMQNVEGTLTKFEVKEGKITWEALIPPAVSGADLNQMGARTVGTQPDGRILINGES